MVSVLVNESHSPIQKPFLPYGEKNSEFRKTSMLKFFLIFLKFPTIVGNLRFLDHVVLLVAGIVKVTPHDPRMKIKASWRLLSFRQVFTRTQTLSSGDLLDYEISTESSFQNKLSN